MSDLLIKKPVISEKSFNLGAKGVYTFLVSDKSEKKQIAREVKEFFKVDVIDVNMINIPGKIKRTRKGSGRRSDIKKALVKIKAGQKIAIFEIEEEKNLTKDKVKKNKREKNIENEEIKKSKE